MELPQTGGCQCGGVRYEITQAPVMVYTCHCTDCQRMTSSAFSLGCVLPDGAFRLVQGEPKGVQRTTGSGRVSTRWVCPECGVWVCTAPRPGATVRNVRGGTLDDTSWLRPTAHIWTRSKQPWLPIPEGDRKFETQPPGDPWWSSVMFGPSPDARSKAAWTVMYSAFICPGSGGPGWGQHSGLRLVHSDGLERPMTQSALAPRCFQAIFVVLA
jgi:hypothetical protein